MAYATTIFPARQALHTLLTGWSWPDGTPRISWGAPTEAEDTAMDAVYQGPPEVEAMDFASFGQDNDEEYTLRVFADVRRFGDSEQSTEQRAWSHVNQILSLARQNQTLSGTVYRMPGWKVTPVVLPSGAKQWRAQIMIEIAVTGEVPPG